MTPRQYNTHSEPRPHIYIWRPCTPLQVRECNGQQRTPPTWAPKVAHDHDYPYTLSAYVQDVQQWMSLTKVCAERHGAVADLGDGQGNVYRTVPQMLFHALAKKILHNREALIPRAGLEFSSLTPQRDETPQLVFICFDTMLERENTLADLGISYPLRAWMLLSLLRLIPKKRSEYLEDMGHNFPRTLEDHQEMKDNIVREKTLESSVGSVGHDGRSGGQAMGKTFLYWKRR